MHLTFPKTTPSLNRPSTNSKVNLGLIVGDFVCVAISCAKLSLHWSFIYTIR